MWCFFDESYPNEGGVTAVAACLMSKEAVRALDIVLYRARRKFFGEGHAKNLTHELKGKDLLSKNSFLMEQKYGESKNLNAVKHIFEECQLIKHRHPIFAFGAAVYGAQDVLKHLNEDRLALPVRDILNKVSVAAHQIPTDERRVDLVFDSQICGAEANIAALTRRFVAGVGLRKVSHYPLTAVSHVSPGIQFADICAFILGRRAVGDARFADWLSLVQNAEWTGHVDGYSRQGIQRYERRSDGKFQIRTRWE